MFELGGIGPGSDILAGLKMAFVSRIELRDRH
jgi:hypothetical protein